MTDKTDLSTSHEHVLNSDKPDNKLEFFWLTFKDSIKNYLTKSELEELSDVSEKLNNLQREERYEEIEAYIKSHIERIGYNMISNDDTYRAGHLENNIKRWSKLTGTDIYPMTDRFYCLLLVYMNLSKNKATTKKDQVSTMKDCIGRYSLDPSDDTILIELMNQSITNKMYGNIDKLKNIVDMHKFIKSEHRDKLGKSFIKNTRSNKLYKYLCGRKTI